MSRLRMLLAALLAAAGLVVLTPSTSYACSCVAASTAGHVRWADAIFVGTLTDIEPPPQRRLMSSADPTTYSFDTRQVLKGDVDPAVEVESAMSGASCGWEGKKVGVEYVVFVSASRGTWQGSLCDGTAESSPSYVAEVAEITGAQPAVVPDLRSLLASIGVLLRFFS